MGSGSESDDHEGAGADSPSVDATASRIRSMQTHSSSAVAIEALSALREVLVRDYPSVEEFERALERASRALQRADPAHASLQSTQREVLERVEATDPETVDAAQEAAARAIQDVTVAMESATEEAGAAAAEFLDDGTTILTHDYSSTVLAAIRAATDAGRSLTVYVTEARPRYIGRRTCRTLATIDAVDAHLIVDSAHGHYLPRCDRVLVGMDCIVDDTLYNRVGTYPIATTAADLDVPMTTVGASTKIVESGFVFENDFRSPSEVMLEPAEGFAVENPAYDATPVRLLDSVITEEGPADL